MNGRVVLGGGARTPYAPSDRLPDLRGGGALCTWQPLLWGILGHDGLGLRSQNQERRIGPWGLPKLRHPVLNAAGVVGFSEIWPQLELQVYAANIVSGTTEITSVGGSRSRSACIARECMSPITRPRIQCRDPEGLTFVVVNGSRPFRLC